MGLRYRPLVRDHPRLRLLRGPKLATQSDKNSLYRRDCEVDGAAAKIPAGIHPASRVADLCHEVAGLSYDTRLLD